MPKPFFAFLLLLSSGLYGQTDSTQNTELKGWAVTLTGALIPIGSTTFGIQPGVEYRFNDHLSLLSEFTFRVGGKYDTMIQDRKYFRLKSEFRYHISNNNSRRVFHEYLGFQAAYSFRQFTDMSGFYYEKQGRDSAIFYDKAALKSPITTFAFQAGTIISDGRFAVDVFMGVGARIVHTKFSEVINPRKDKVFPREFFIPAAYNYKGTVTQLHFNAGLRLIWHFYNFRHPVKK